MMSRTLVALAITMSASISFVTAQSVVVRPKKVAYKRTAKNLSNFKRSFEVRYPVFSGKASPAALRRLRAGTDYWRVFEMKLADNLRDDTWLSSFDYIVKYNKNNILDIWLIMEGAGAYPDGSIKYLVFDTRTGRQLTIADLFVGAGLPALMSRVRDVMKQNEAEAFKENDETREALEGYRENDPEFHPTLDKIDFKDLDGFSISDAGVTFIYDYGFPHVVEALEPSNEIFISYRDLRPFLRRDGLLARFIR